jgi:hypothetical protein
MWVPNVALPARAMLCTASEACRAPGGIVRGWPVGMT